MDARWGNRNSHGCPSSCPSTMPGGSMIQYQMEKMRIFDTAISTTSAISAAAERDDSPASTAMRTAVYSSNIAVKYVLAMTMTLHWARLRFNVQNMIASARTTTCNATRTPTISGVSIGRWFLSRLRANEDEMPLWVIAMRNIITTTIANASPRSW